MGVVIHAQRFLTAAMCSRMAFPQYPYLNPFPMSFVVRTARCIAFLATGWGLPIMGIAQSAPVASAAVAPLSYPAAAGFDVAGSDARAVAVADRVMRCMGGYTAWQNARYFAWSFFGDQYQIWDKYTGDFHWEKGPMVANYNLNSKKGHAYRNGVDISATPDGQKLLGQMTSIWINNSYWLLMPFKMKDSGVTLKHKGMGQTMDGAAADVLQMTFKNVGDTPQNRYEVLVNRASGLVEEWAYFEKSTDAQPGFRTRWNGYGRHGALLLAAGRGAETKPAHFDNVTQTQVVPQGVMGSSKPVVKLR